MSSIVFHAAGVGVPSSLPSTSAESIIQVNSAASEQRFEAAAAAVRQAAAAAPPDAAFVYDRPSGRRLSDDPQVRVY